MTQRKGPKPITRCIVRNTESLIKILIFNEKAKNFISKINSMAFKWIPKIVTYFDVIKQV